MAGTIVNGQPPEADSFMNAYGSNFNDTAQMIFNADYIGFDSQLNETGIPNLKNVFFDTGLSGDFAGFGDSLYDFSGVTVDNTIWTETETNGGAVTQNEALIMTCPSIGPNPLGITAMATSDGSTGINIIDGSYFTKYTFSLTKGSSSVTNATTNIIITDGSASVTIKANVQSSAGSQSGTDNLRININKTSETAFVTTDFQDSTDTGISLASLDNGIDWFIAFSCTGNQASSSSDRSSGNMSVTRLSEMNNVTDTEFIIDVGTASSTVTNIISILNITNPTLATNLISVDGGSNFEAITTALINRPSNTGTGIKLKVQLGSDGGGNIAVLNEWACKYNFY